MNRAEALAPSLTYKPNNAPHKSRSKTKLKPSAPKRKDTHTKPQRNHHHNNHSNHHSHPHPHHPNESKSNRSNHYSNGAGNGHHHTAPNNEETDALLSLSSFTPSPSPHTFHANLHNTYHHHHKHNYKSDISLIYGFVRSCIHKKEEIVIMDDDFDDDFDIALFIPCSVTQLILLYICDFNSVQSGSFVWKLPTLELLTAHSLQSVPFCIGSFLFNLSIYPNGVDVDHIGFSNLYINLPCDVSILVGSLVVNARLYCIETKSCWSSIKSFSVSSSSHGWQKGALRIGEICKYKSLTFVVYINILRILSSIDSSLLYQYRFCVNICKFVIKWKMDSLLLADLRIANEMKRFESDICNYQWVLGCVPNGIKKDNEASVFKMYLKLCALPPSIFKIKVKFNIICIETGKHIKYIYHDFDYKHKYWQTDKLCKRSYLIFNDFNSLRFRAEIEIIEEYDLNYNEVSSNVFQAAIDNKCVYNLINCVYISPYRLRLLIIGFTSSNQFTKLIQSFYPTINCDLFRWNINLEEILKLSQLNAKQRFDSAIFIISSLKWFLQIYPNGYRPEDEGFCSVYLILAYLPSILSEITIHFCVYCPQTMSNFSTIHTFNHSRDGRGTRRMLSLNHLAKLKEKHITFNCYINILRIKHNETHIIYQYPLKLNKINYKQYIYTSFEWKIDKNMIKKFKQSNNGQRFESKIFNEMWNLSIFPNENKNKIRKNEEQNVVIGIRLCSLPKDIQKIKVHYKLICKEFQQENEWQHTAYFDYDNYYVKTPKHTIKSQYINRYNQLTFKATIRILKLYDLNQQIVDKYH